MPGAGPAQASAGRIPLEWLAGFRPGAFGGLAADISPETVWVGLSAWYILARLRRVRWNLPPWDKDPRGLIQPGEERQAAGLD